MECHLDTSAHHVPSAIRNYDRDLYSFCAGEQLADYKLYFGRPKDEKTDDFETAQAAYELRSQPAFATGDDLPHLPRSARYSAG